MASKKKKRTPSRIVRSERSYPEASDVRRRAEREFLQDPDANSVPWHWENNGFNKYISLSTFVNWSTTGEWVRRRIDYWRAIEERLLSHMADRLLDQKIKELEDIKVVRDAVVEMLMPVKNRDGSLKRHPESGNPMFKVEVPSYEKLVIAFLDLDARIGLRTGDVTERIEVGSGTGDAARRIASMGSSKIVANLTQEEAQVLARKLLLTRNSALGDNIIEAEVEDDGDEEEDQSL